MGVFPFYSCENLIRVSDYLLVRNRYHIFLLPVKFFSHTIPDSVDEIIFSLSKNGSAKQG
jgi:hypothetical protein